MNIWRSTVSLQYLGSCQFQSSDTSEYLAAHLSLQLRQYLSNIWICVSSSRAIPPNLLTVAFLAFWSMDALVHLDWCLREEGLSRPTVVFWSFGSDGSFGRRETVSLQYLGLRQFQSSDTSAPPQNRFSFWVFCVCTLIKKQLECVR